MAEKGKKDKDTGKGQGLSRGKATFYAIPADDIGLSGYAVGRKPYTSNSPNGPFFDTEREALDYASELQRETRGMKKGGKVSSASKRADGCAVRGKTKGRMV